LLVDKNNEQKEKKNIPEARDVSASRASFVVVECYGDDGVRRCPLGGDGHCRSVYGGGGGGRRRHFDDVDNAVYKYIIIVSRLKKGRKRKKNIPRLRLEPHSSS
jgi:hypothetical protein